MHRGNRRQPGVGYKCCAHKGRRWHGRDQARTLLHDITMNSANVNVLKGNAPTAKRETLVEFWDKKGGGYDLRNRR